MKSIAILVTFLVSISACVSNSFNDGGDSPMRSSQACSKHAGEWMPFRHLYPTKVLSEDDMRRYVCNLPTNEGGIACKDSGQCKGQCLSPVGAEPGQAVTGECSAFTLVTYGTVSVVNGRVPYPTVSTVMTQRKAAMLQRLVAARQQWTSLSIEDYGITIADEDCYCPYGPYYGPNRVIVYKGKISRVVYRGERRDGFRRGDSLTRKSALKVTINEVFDNLEQRIREMTANATLNVVYHSHYGFPTIIDFDRPDMHHVHSKLVISDFRAY